MCVVSRNEDQPTCASTKIWEIKSNSTTVTQKSFSQSNKM